MIKGSETGTPKSRPPYERSSEAGAGVRPALSAVNSSLRDVPHFNLLAPTAEDRKRRRLALGLSPALEALAILMVVWALASMPHRPEATPVNQETLVFRLATPPPPVKHELALIKEPRIPRLKAAPVLPVLRRQEAPKPQPHELQPPKIAEPRIEIPNVRPAPATFASVRIPPRPKRLIVPVRTGAFAPGSAAPGTLKRRPLRKVQTGGFGADNGIPGDPQENSHTKIARLGSFDLPSGPGHGNGTGGAQGVRGTVESAGFGNAVGSARGNSHGHLVENVRESGFGNAVGGHGSGSAPGAVRQGGFGSVVPGVNAPRTHTASREAFQPVVILSKPNPVYPAAARKLHIEGDVILHVVFEASGKLDILGIEKGLGHGMDQAAIQAAENIRFKPAERDGHPVNSTARVHIIFQLAY